MRRSLFILWTITLLVLIANAAFTYFYVYGKLEHDLLMPESIQQSMRLGMIVASVFLSLMMIPVGAFLSVFLSLIPFRGFPFEQKFKYWIPIASIMITVVFSYIYMQAIERKFNYEESYYSPDNIFGSEDYITIDDCTDVEPWYDCATVKNGTFYSYASYIIREDSTMTNVNPYVPDTILYTLYWTGECNYVLEWWEVVETDSGNRISMPNYEEHIITAVDDKGYTYVNCDFPWQENHMYYSDSIMNNY